MSGAAFFVLDTDRAGKVTITEEWWKDGGVVYCRRNGRTEATPFTDVPIVEMPVLPDWNVGGV